MKRIRGELSLRDLESRLEDLGTRITASGLQKIEAGSRRVDVDELLALAVALNVNPNALLLPNYAGDADVSYDVTAMPDGATGADIWAWADGWKALPHHRENAPAVETDATGWEQGRQMHATRSVEQGRGFLDRIRPDGESSAARNFLAEVTKTLSELESGDWLSVWFHSNNPQRFDTKREGPIGARVVAYPEGGWSDISKYFDRIKAELAGIIGSDTARPFIQEVLAKRGSGDGND